MAGRPARVGDRQQFPAQTSGRQIQPDVCNEIRDQHPHDCEVPVPCAGEPSAEREHGWYRLVFERIAAEHFPFPGERRISVEDAEPAADHDDNGDEVHPVGDAHDPVMTFSALNLCRRVRACHACPLDCGCALFIATRRKNAL